MRTFLSFADSRLSPSLERISRQAADMRFFDSIDVQDERDLDRNFKRQFRSRLKKNSRGYGYWCWKPQIVLRKLYQLEDGDTLLYADAGCHLNPAGRKRLAEYFEIAEASKSGILAFQAQASQGPLYHDGRELADLRDLRWTKGDLIDYLGVRNRDDILQSPTIIGTTFLCRKSPDAIRIFERMQDIFTHKFHLMDDTPSQSSNSPEFIEHRHDQSCFSILCKLEGVETVSSFETWHPKADAPDQPDWEALAEFPIHARRDKKAGRWHRKLEKTKQSLRAAFRARSSTRLAVIPLRRQPRGQFRQSR